MFYKRSTRVLLTAACLLSLAGCDKPQDTAAKHITRANAYFQKSDFDKARIEYLNAARLLPADADVRYRLGLAEESLGNFSEAFKNFTVAEQQDPRHKGALLKLAQYFMIAENDAELDKRLSSIFLLSPDEAEAHALTAARFLRQKKTGEAEKEALAALATDPANKTARATLAGAYRTEGQQDKAIRMIEDGLDKNKEDVALLVLLAVLYDEHKQPDKVEDTYHRLIKAEPNIDRFRLDLAKIYAEHGKSLESEKVLRNGIKALPEASSLRREMIRFLSTTKGLEEAEQEATRQTEERPDDKSPLFWLADLYIQKGETAKATRLLENLANNAIDLSPSLMAQASLASLKLSEGDRIQAAKLVDAVLKKDPNNQPASLLRAAIDFEEGRLDDAVTLLRTILRDAPKNEKALRLLGESLLRQGHKELALDSFGRLVESDPTDLAAKVRLAQLYALQNDHKKAYDILRLVTKINPLAPVAWESLARIAIGAKDWTTAGHAIRTLEGLDGQKSLAAFLRANLVAANDKPTEAMPLYLPLIEENPESPLAEYALAAYLTAARASGTLSRALGSLGTISFTSPTMLELMGDGFADAKDGTKAFDLYTESIKAGTKRVEPFLGSARLLIAENKRDEAIPYLLQARSAAPNDPRPQMMQAGLLIDAGKIDEAIEIYEALLQTDKSNDLAANNLACLLADTRAQDARAMNYARQLAERFAKAQNPLLRDTLAWVLLRQGKLNEATPLFEALDTNNQNLPAQALYHLGLWHLKANRPEDAQKYLKKALSGHDSFTGRDEAEKILAGM